MSNSLTETLAAAPSATVCLHGGEILLNQGETVSDVYVVVSGYLKFSRVVADGAETITAILNPGQVFGAGFSNTSESSDTVAAKDSATLERYEYQEFSRLLALDAGLAQAVMAMLTNRQALLERRLQAVLHLDVRARIAVILNDLCCHHGQHCVHGHEVDVPLTQQELAEFVGASRPVVSARLNELRRECIVSYTRSHLCVDNVKKLQALADFEM